MQIVIVCLFTSTLSYLCVLRTGLTRCPFAGRLQDMVFARTYSKKSGLSVAVPSLKRDEPRHSNGRQQDVVLQPDLLQHQIAPFLRTRDLMRVGITCRSMRDMVQAGLVKQVCTREIPRGRVSLLMQQLHLPRFSKLTSLDLSYAALTDTDYQMLARVVKDGGLNLKVLRLRHKGRYPPSSFSDTQILPLLSVMEIVPPKGSLPRLSGLEELDLSGNGIGDAGISVVIRWLGAGGGRRLRRLGLSFVAMSERGMLALLQILGRGVSPIVTRLAMAYNGVEHEPDDEGGRRALWLRAFLAMPHLIDLELRESGVEGEVTLAVADAVQRGACRKLRRLSLGGCALTDEGMEPFLDQLHEGSCLLLQELDVRLACLNNDSFLRLARVLAAGRLPNLKRLNLADNNLSYEGMQAIVAALDQGVAPKLERLTLSSTGNDFEETNEMTIRRGRPLRRGPQSTQAYGRTYEALKQGVILRARQGWLADYSKDGDLWLTEGDSHSTAY